MPFELKPPRWYVSVHVLAQWGLVLEGASSDIAAISKNMQSQTDIQAEVEAAGGVTPLQRCWTHPKPRELGSEESELN